MPLANLSRIPVCPACLSAPRPLVAAHSCTICCSPFLDVHLLDGPEVCTACRARSDVSFDAVYCYGDYEGPLRDLIRLFKYSKIESLARHFGNLMIEAMPRERHFDLIIPMPMHWYRKWQRGFNQAELLARPVARLYRLPVSKNLHRISLGKRQAGLGATARRQNLQHAFQVARPAQLKGKRLLLVDDVLTTGTTLAAAAAQLKAAGATHVTALTLARVPRRGGLERFLPAQKLRRAKVDLSKSELIGRSPELSGLGL